MDLLYILIWFVSSLKGCNGCTAAEISKSCQLIFRVHPAYPSVLLFLLPILYSTLTCIVDVQKDPEGEYDDHLKTTTTESDVMSCPVYLITGQSMIGLNFEQWMKHDLLFLSPYFFGSSQSHYNYNQVSF